METVAARARRAGGDATSPGRLRTTRRCPRESPPARGAAARDTSSLSASLELPNAGAASDFQLVDEEFEPAQLGAVQLRAPRARTVAERDIEIARLRELARQLGPRLRYARYIIARTFMRRARQPMSRQLAAHLLVELRKRVLGARPEAPGQVRRHAREERDQRQHERDAELFPVGVADAQSLQQPTLLSLAESDDLIVPERVRCIPGEAQLREHRVLAQESAGQRLAAFRERRFEPALD